MFKRSMLLLFCTVFLSLSSAGVFAEGMIIGEHLQDRILESPHPYPGSPTGEAVVVWSDYYEFPDANYLVFQFSKFDLGPGDWVEIHHPFGERVHVYSGKGLRNLGGDFITKAVMGSEAVIELYSSNPTNKHYGYKIDRITRGFSNKELDIIRSAGSRAICGTDDKIDAICYETSHPQAYDKSKAAARILMDGDILCTAWLVSCENHVMTNSHCSWDGDLDSQSKLDRMEFQFMYQKPACGSGTATVEYSFQSGTFLENNHYIDYALIQAPVTEDPASVYGWMNIDDRPLPEIDEQMYIVGHPSGVPKQISLYSTHAQDQSGLCEVYTVNADPCISGATAPEVGYYCDTEGGSSGSPVLSLVTHKVIALHHCANCPNRGIRIADVWTANQAGSHPLPPCTLYNDIGIVDLDRTKYGCDDVIEISVNDGSLLGVGTQDVTISSDTEITPETITLVETPSDSGTFLGSINVTTIAPVTGDEVLSVVAGDQITVLYIDADDGQGGINIPRNDYADVDCTEPIISNVVVDFVSA
ncbi:serine protease, partial [bacterium]|nr:serine protease [bacterium]